MNGVCSEDTGRAVVVAQVGGIQGMVSMGAWEAMAEIRMLFCLQS